MKQVMVRYKVKRDRAAGNESYMAKVFEELQRDKPPGVRYAAGPEVGEQSSIPGRV